MIYGHFLYFSPEADTCSDHYFLMYIMLFLLLEFYFKCCMIGFLVTALVGFVCLRYRKKRNAVNQSEQVLKSLIKTKFGQMVLNQAPSQLAERVITMNNDEANPECVICFMNFTESDEVVKLKCNEKHFFHTKCIEDWIK
jgi:membrane glycosyltransferase